MHPKKEENQKLVQNENAEFDAKIIGAFSVINNENSRGELVLSRESCQYVYAGYSSPMPVQFDLNDGIDNIVLKSDVSQTFDRTIDVLLKYILSDRSCLDQSDFVCTRLLLRKLMGVPYESSFGNGLDILATKFEGKIYLREYSARPCFHNHSRGTDKYGLNFERFMVTG